ncbi:MAG TPA: M14 family metallopeptidase [Dongiaceae bacterium]|nr:M14 family metallopeptidase [Dongiaceae bacterium]
MKANPYFRTTYQAARQAFRDAATARGLQVTAHANPAKGAEGEELTTDVTLIGPKDAERLLICTSATHGAEGFCGSGIQVSWLAEGGAKSLPANTAVLVVHAVNPHGFSHVRRVNEDNVDLNRNFVDHAKPYPGNKGYDDLRDAICPSEWTEESRARTRKILLDYAAQHGEPAMTDAIAAGQYVDPQGVFYGGTKETWSNRNIRAILAPFAKTVKRAAFVDLHTGLGPYGFGEIMSNHGAKEPGHFMMKEWWGNEATYFDDGTSSSYLVLGDINIGVCQTLSNAKVAGITLEYGTIPKEDMISSVRADNWLYVHGKVDSPQGREIKAQIRAAFYQEHDDWKQMVAERGHYVLNRMLKCVTES